MISLEPVPGPPAPQFPLGEIVITQAAAVCVDKRTIVASLRRHVTGDWGELDAEDIQTNNQALAQGGRLLSVYTTPKGDKFYIITEADRSITTILLPEDY